MSANYRKTSVFSMTFFSISVCRENYLFECTCDRCEDEIGGISETSSEDEDEDDDDDDDEEEDYMDDC